MKKTLNVMAVILVSCALAAWGLTTVTGQHLINSVIDSTSIGATTPSTGAFTTLSSLWSRVSSGPPTTSPINTMMTGWNATAGGGEGDFVNDQGTGGPGGFDWFSTSSAKGHAWSATAPIMVLHSDGSLFTAGSINAQGGAVTATGGFSTPGSVSAASMSASTFTGTLNGRSSTASALASSPANCPSATPAVGIQANGNANCGSYPSSLGAISGYTTLPGGIIIQWTRGVSQSTSGFTQIVNFPISFPHNCLSVQVSALVNSPADTDVSFYQVVGYSANSVTVFMARNADHAFQPTTPLVYAIGF